MKDEFERDPSNCTFHVEPLVLDSSHQAGVRERYADAWRSGTDCELAAPFCKGGLHAPNGASFEMKAETSRRSNLHCPRRSDDGPVAVPDSGLVEHFERESTDRREILCL